MKINIIFEGDLNTKTRQELIQEATKAIDKAIKAKQEEEFAAIADRVAKNEYSIADLVTLEARLADRQASNCKGKRKDKEEKVAGIKGGEASASGKTASPSTASDNSELEDILRVLCGLELS